MKRSITNTSGFSSEFSTNGLNSGNNISFKSKEAIIVESETFILGLP